MPSQREHLQKASDNATLAQQLETGRYTDWAVTTLFCAALHLIDAYLLSQGKNPGDHGERIRQIRTDAQLRPIWLPYRNLLDRSLEARFECQAFTIAQVQTLRRYAFAAIEQHVQQRLG